MYQTIISAHELHQTIQDGEPIVCDCRFDIHRPQYGHQAFTQGHIPTAVYVDLEQELSAKPDGTNGRHPLPTTEALVDVVQSLGITNHVQVIVYDDEAGGYASLLWWILKYLGHESAAVLDGGIQAWIAAGFDLTQESKHPERSTFLADPNNHLLIEYAEVLSILGDDSVILLDSRAPERYSGEEEPLDPIAGHIPGAKNRYWRANLEDDGKFKPGIRLREELSGYLQDRSSEQAVVYCGSGVTACHNLLAFAHAGYPMPRLYAGSWSEWCSDPTRPIVQGEASAAD